jgi:hypothetical protein
MTVNLIESFDGVTTASQLANKWTTSLGSIVAGGRNGQGYSLASQALSKVFSVDTFRIIGFAYKLTSFPGVNTEIFRMSNAANNAHTAIQVNSSGQLRFWLPSTTAFTTETLVAGQWAYIEIKMVSATQTILRLNELTVITSTHGSAGTRSRINWQAVANATVDDIYISTLGGTNPDLLGNVVVEALRPNGDGNYSQWVNSNGNSTNNSTFVDEQGQDDSDYVQSSVVNDKDSYAHTNLAPGGLPDVAAVQHTVRAAFVDSARNLAMLQRLSGTDAEGGTITLTNTLTNYERVFETKPGGGAWARADVDAAEFGYVVK